MTLRRRFHGLDLLRGIAAILVCLFHFGIFRFGCIGVDLFFLISGFVIFFSLSKRNSLNEFWISRLVRLYPTYWLSIVVAILCYYCFDYQLPEYSLKNIVGNLTMLQPAFKSQSVSGVYWTLYVELLFYLFISLIWKCKGFNYIETIIILCLTFASIMHGLHLTLLKSNTIFTHIFVIVRYLIPLLSHIQSFSAGIIFYLIYEKSFDTKKIFILLYCIFCVALFHRDSVMINSFIDMQEHFVSNVFIYIFFALFLFTKQDLFNRQSLLFWGAISYPLYLIHDTFGLSLCKYISNYAEQFVAAFVGVCGSILLAWIITYKFDIPLRKKLNSYKNRSGTAS